MMNLLPRGIQTHERYAYMMRLSVVLVWALAILVVVNTIFFIPLFLYARGEVSLAKQEYSPASPTSPLLGSGPRVADINKELASFATQNARIAEKFIPSDLVAKILSFKTGAITISGISYASSVDREQVVIRGNARDRESLLRFVEDIRASGVFTMVDLPVKSYVVRTNIDFSLSATKPLKLQKTNAKNK